MTQKRLQEITITNQVLALAVVILSLALGVAVGKQNSWLKHEVIEVAPMRSPKQVSQEMSLPKSLEGTAINRLIATRRSNRPLLSQALEADQVAGLLWAMQGITAEWGERAVPTIRGAYPLQLTLYARSVNGIEKGLYEYDSEGSLKRIADVDQLAVENVLRKSSSLVDAPVIIAVSGHKEKLKSKLDGQERNELLYYEAGHAVQNVFLEAESMGLSVTPLIQLDADVQPILQIPQDEVLITVLAIGYPKEK